MAVLPEQKYSLNITNQRMQLSELIIGNRSAYLFVQILHCNDVMLHIIRVNTLQYIAFWSVLPRGQN